MLNAQVYSSFGQPPKLCLSNATCEARSALKNAFGERSLLWSLRMGNFGDSLSQSGTFQCLHIPTRCDPKLRLEARTCMEAPAYPPPARAYESSVWSPAALVMGAGGGGGAAAAVRRIVDTVRKYKEVRSVEMRSVEDGVRDGLGEGVVEAEADESALPPDEGDHQLCNQRCNQHAINDELALPPDEGDHQLCNQRCNQHAINDELALPPDEGDHQLCNQRCNQHAINDELALPPRLPPTSRRRLEAEPPASRAARERADRPSEERLLLILGRSAGAEPRSTSLLGAMRAPALAWPGSHQVPSCSQQLQTSPGDIESPREDFKKSWCETTAMDLSGRASIQQSTDVNRSPT